MTIHRTFRFGTGAYLVASRAELLTLVRKIEDFGYNICLTPDHFENIFSPGVALMVIAEASQTLRIGTTVDIIRNKA
jgi:alkanesulfonate monooxygenase SsuD/methylene tetrahydromethanopterin reductase-like flavin-dependent oxidoreductase (luciferase family)